MLYEKKINYLDYCVSGEKKRGAGFVKSEVRDGILRLHININGIYTAKPLDADVILIGGEKAARPAKIRLENGAGELRDLKLKTDKLGGGLTYGELEKLRIPLSEKCEIVCFWRRGETPKQIRGEKESTEREKEQGEPGKEKGEAEKTGEDWEGGGEENTKVIEIQEEEKLQKEDREKEWGGKEKHQEEREQEREEHKQEGGEHKQEREERYQEGKEGSEREKRKEKRAENGRTQEEEGFRKEREEGWQEETGAQEYRDKSSRLEEMENYPEMTEEDQDKTGKKQETAKKSRVDGFNMHEKAPLEDKWRQLAAIYPHMNISGEISDCLTLKPADFVILPQRYYSLVTNSFLLHGYHNYGHLVLARAEKRGEIKYYIGVPGIFFDKERQVALMFGFECFECGKDFAKQGDFGYYLIRVEL